jgi:hypothetical protein
MKKKFKHYKVEKEEKYKIKVTGLNGKTGYGQKYDWMWA